MNVDGSGQRRLTCAQGFDGYPAWSPDSRRLVFASGRGRDIELELYVMNADGRASVG
jgi:Tol biopolymer transport system component